MILLLSSLVILRSAAAADVGYFWHVSDFHLDPRYGSNVTRAGARDIFLGDYDEVSMSCSDSCEAQGKGSTKGRPSKVTQRSFIDGGWWVVDILSLMLYIKFGCHTPPTTTTTGRLILLN